MTTKQVLVLLLAAVAVACGDDEKIVNPPPYIPVAAVEIVSPPAELMAGDTARLTAVPRDASGRPLSGRAIDWDISDPNVAAVTQTGRVTAIAEGLTFISASSEGRVGRTQLRVIPRPVPAPVVASVTIDRGATLTLPYGQITHLRAEARAADGTVIAGRTVAWVSSHPAIVHVSAGGMIEALATGNAVVTATIDGKSASIAITVPQYVTWIDIDPRAMSMGVGEIRQIQALPRTAEGHVVNTVITWTSSDTSVATVAGAGRVTAKKPGWTYITATAEGKSGRSTVFVYPWSQFDLATVNGAPPPVTLYTAMELDVNNTPRTVRYDVADGGIRLSFGADRYEQAFQFWVYREGQVVTSGLYVTRGNITYNWLTGLMHFHPDDGSPEFTTEPSPAGTLILRQRYKAGAPEAVLKYQTP